MTILSRADHDRIAAAVGAAEEKTSGEIVCILTREVSEYRETPLAWAAAAALVLPPVAVLLGFDPAALAAAREWSAGADSLSLLETIAWYTVAQGAVFLAVLLLVLTPAIRRLLTPSALKAHRVHKAAMTQFLATGLTNAADRTGVVIFASLGDRKVEVLADKLIHDAVGEAVWTKAVAAVQTGMKRSDPGGGFVDAVAICGGALAEHFPAKGERVNALADGPLEL